jgi:uncharacterized protein (TIGR02246 family)
MHVRKMVFAVLLLAITGSTVAMAKDTSADEQAIRTLDGAWDKAAQAKDVDKSVSFYADDASMLPPGMPIANGKDAIRAVWTQLLSAPGGALTFAPSKVLVSSSGDMAYEIGAFQATANDAQGKPATSTGKFVVVWRKRGGQWKVAADIFNDDK